MRPSEIKQQTISRDTIAILPHKRSTRACDSTADLRYIFRLAAEYAQRRSRRTAGKESRQFRTWRDRFDAISDELECLFELSGKLHPDQYVRVSNALSRALKLIGEQKKEVDGLVEAIIEQLAALPCEMQ